MTIKEKKRKLSEILGINLFEPKYKEIDSILSEDEVLASEVEEEANENNLDKPLEDDGTEKSFPKSDVNHIESESEDQSDSEEVAHNEQEEQSETNDGGDEADGEKQSNQTAEDYTADTDETGSETDMEAELFDAKLEAKLLRAGIRDDKLDAAKKLFKSDHTLTDIDKVEKWVKDYPEWIKQRQSEPAKAFGMDVGENNTGETAEEKRLRELGII